MKKSKYFLLGKTVAGVLLLLMTGLWFNPGELFEPVTVARAAQPPGQEGGTASQIIPDGATVIIDGLNLREGPGTNFAVIGSLQTGDVLTIINRSLNSNWIEVVTPDSQTGWVFAVPQYIRLNVNLDEMFVSPKLPELLSTPQNPIPLASIPVDGTNWGLTEFVWHFDGQLAENEAFEVSIWQTGELPQGVHDAASDKNNGNIKLSSHNTYHLTVDISQVPGFKGPDNNYLWTVLVVQIEPYVYFYNPNPEAEIAVSPNVEPTGVPLGNPTNAIVKVFYGTDRDIIGYSNLGTEYGIGKGQFSYGIAEVSIPRNHKRGELESPSIWKLEFRPDPEKHVVLLKVKSQSSKSFFTELRARVNQTKQKEAFVFIHGFNVKFQDALLRTAQMAKDLSLDAAPILYSWPSDGNPLPWGYRADEADVTWSTPHLKAFLAEVAQRTGVETLHLIAHSMGSQALVKALSNSLPEDPSTVFRQVVLAAPDIDAEVFKWDLAPKLITGYPSVTLYASSKDIALLASRSINGWHWRAGYAGPDLVVLDRLDTIDASDVDTEFFGHGYYADNLRVIADMCYLFKDRKAPGERGLEEGIPPPDGTYWKFGQQSNGFDPDECFDRP